MVHVAFKTVYLFLAFFALPQVLAAPGAANLDRRAPFPLPQEVQDEALKLLNALRAPKAPRLTWSINLSALSAIYASSCGTDRVTSFETLALTDSLPEAIRQWGSDKVQRNMITPDFLHSVGCAIVNCGGFHTTACVYGEDR